MLDLQIDRLQLEIMSVSGHEHRIRPIAARAVELFAARLEQHHESIPAAAQTIANVQAAPVSVAWDHMTDDEVAGAVADAWLGSISSRLKV